jgi:hypothetical protein
MKLAVIGSRTFKDYDLMKEELSKLNSKEEITEIVSGGAKGADSLAERYAKEFNIPVKVFEANWDKHGRRAGPLRNIKIVDYCDSLIAFWDSKSTGTKHSIGLAKEQKKSVVIVRF